MSQVTVHRRVQRRLERAHLGLDAGTLEQLVAYFELLSRWNLRINLTARVDTDESIDRLIVEPVLASRFLPRGQFRLLDIGSGGGSPAIPLKVMAPGMRLWMVEAKVRKCAFLREAVRHLGLADTTVEAQRVERLLAAAELRASVDVVSVRAVRVDPDLLTNAARLLTPAGRVFLFTHASRGNPVRLVPDLDITGREPLVEALRSELVILGRPGGSLPPSD